VCRAYQYPLLSSFNLHSYLFFKVISEIYEYAILLNNHKGLETNFQLASDYLGKILGVFANF
jgi:hypothetical protein